MTTRQFCKLGIGVLAAAVIPSRDEKQIDYQVFLTKNILISRGDGTVELNVYGEYVALISQIRLKGKSDYICDSRFYRFESTPLLESEISDKHFRIFVDAIDLYIKQNNGYSPSEFCPIIKIPV